MQSHSEISPNTIPNKIIDEKIELLIQQTYNVTIPSIVLKFISQDEENFEMSDFFNFYSQFGEVIKLLLYDKLSIVLYKNFFAANACLKFLQNENNFKVNMRKKIIVNWLNLDNININFPTDTQKLFTEIHNNNLNNLKKVDNPNIFEKTQFEQNLDPLPSNIIKFNPFSETFPQKITSLLPQSNIYNNNNNQINEINNPPGNVINQIIQNQYSSNNLYLNQNTNPLVQSNNPISNYSTSNSNVVNVNTISNKNVNLNVNNPQNILNVNNNINNNNVNNNNVNDKNNEQKTKKETSKKSEEKSGGKYICKYEILIPNDNNFQVVKKIIGVNGCNMKKIVNECTASIGHDPNIKNKNEGKNNVKLRLRGIGSGYKEGKKKVENNESLHLYVSAKNEEYMKKCCELIDELLEKIYEEYIIFCKKNNITPLATKLAQKVAFGGKFIKKSK